MNSQFIVWRGNSYWEMPLSGVLPTDLLQDANDGKWYPATNFFTFAPPPPPPPPPPMSFEVCYEQPNGAKTCAKATGPGPAIFGAALLGLVVGVCVGVKLA